MPDPNEQYAMNVAGLARNFAQPPMDDTNPAMSAPILGPSFAAYRQRANALQSSARMSPTGAGTPVATHLVDAKDVHQTAVQNQQQVAQQQQIAAASAMDQGTPAAAQANASGAAQNHQYTMDRDAMEHLRLQQAQKKAGMPTGGGGNFNAAGVTLGQQEDGGRNVELIEGNRSHVEHFNQQGDNTGVLPAAGTNAVSPHLQDMLAGASPEHVKSLTAYAAAGATPQQIMAARHQLEGNAATAKADSFEKATAQDRWGYDHAVRMEQMLTKKATVKDPLGETTMDLNRLSPDEQQAYHQSIQTQREAGHRISNWGKPAAPPEQAPMSVRDQVLQAQAHFGEHADTSTQQRPNIPRAPKPGTMMSVQIAQTLNQEARKNSWTREQTLQHAKDAGWMVPQ